MRFSVKLNHAGIAAIAKGPEMQALVASAAEKIAANVRSQGITVGDTTPGTSSEIDLPVEVETSVGKRARAAVVLAHPAGAAVQAKHGALTRAAAAEGLSVRGGGS